jgi:hypothetical protein
MSVSRKELEAAFAFLIVKVIDLNLKTEDGHDICPMHGFCPTEDDCILDRIMEDTQQKNIQKIKKSKRYC